MGTGGQRQSLLLVTSVASDRLLSPLSPCSHQWIRPLGKAERGYRCFGFCAQMIHSLCDEGPGSCGAWRVLGWQAAGGGGGLRNCASRSRVTFTVSASVIIFQFSHAEVRALGSRKLNILL